MICTRCHGLMIPQACWKREWKQVSRRWPKPFYLWSCVNCGECVDETILFNRNQTREPMTIERHRRIWCRIKALCREVAA